MSVERDRKAQIVQAILDNTTAVIYAKDAFGRYQFVNRRFEDLFGVTLAEIVGRTDFDVFPMSQAHAFHVNDEIVLRDRRPIEFEEVAPHQDGPHTYISLKFPYWDENGDCVGVCGISTDITPRKLIEAALQESDERFRQLAENIPECFWITDMPSNRVLYVSPAYERIWKRPCSEVYENADAWLEAIHPDDRQRVNEAFVEKAVEGDFSEEYRIIQPNGTVRWIADRGFPIKDRDGTVYRVAGVAADITERRELEQKITEISAYERRRISRDLHDSLGQQLTGLGYLAKNLTNRLINQSPQNAPTAEEILQGLQSAISEVRRIVRGLAPVGIDAAGLKDALQRLADSTTNTFGVHCSVEVNDDAELSDNGIATELYRIAQEGVNNAVKHSGARRIVIGLRKSNAKLELSVHDDGSWNQQKMVDGNVGMGLRIMRYRSNRVGASFNMKNSKTGGTLISVVLAQE